MDYKKPLIIFAIAAVIIIVGAVAVYFLLSPSAVKTPGATAETYGANPSANVSILNKVDRQQAVPPDTESPEIASPKTEIPASSPPAISSKSSVQPALSSVFESAATPNQPESSESQAPTLQDPTPQSGGSNQSQPENAAGNSTPLDTASPATVGGIPEVLAPYYNKAPIGASYSDLPDSTSQLVVVDDTGGKIRALFFERNEGKEWVEVPELAARAWGGSNGIRPKQREGDKVTPVGQYPVMDAFFIDDKPETGLDTFQITNDTYWIDDPASVNYNKRVEGTENKDWNSAEHMISYYSSYKYGFVIGYNLGCTPGLGSAVFFHVAQRNTIGCVGVAEKDCLRFLARLDKEKNPYILIVSDKEALK